MRQTDGCLELVSGQHPDLDARFFEICNCFGNAVLKLILDRSCTQKKQASLNFIRCSLDLVLPVFDRRERRLISRDPGFILVLRHSTIGEGERAETVMSE